MPILIQLVLRECRSVLCIASYLFYSILVSSSTFHCVCFTLSLFSYPDVFFLSFTLVCVSFATILFVPLFGPVLILCGSPSLLALLTFVFLCFHLPDSVEDCVSIRCRKPCQDRKIVVMLRREPRCKIKYSHGGELTKDWSRRHFLPVFFQLHFCFVFDVFSQGCLLAIHGGLVAFSGTSLSLSVPGAPKQLSSFHLLDEFSPSLPFTWVYRSVLSCIFLVSFYFAVVFTLSLLLTLLLGFRCSRSFLWFFLFLLSILNMFVSMVALQESRCLNALFPNHRSSSSVIQH